MKKLAYALQGLGIFGMMCIGDAPVKVILIGAAICFTLIGIGIKLDRATDKEQ